LTRNIKIKGVLKKIIIELNLPCCPGFIQSITSLSARTALTGMIPPPNAFPNI
jgi:hypothetical protein